MPTNILVPDIGDFKDVEVIDVLVKPGDQIELETPLITLETEKATIDVPASAAGVVKSVAVKKGESFLTPCFHNWMRLTCKTLSATPKYCSKEIHY